jgi:glutathione S-transferase
VHERGLNLAQSDKTKPDYLKINPTARIRILIDPNSTGGTPLTLIKSWAILYYLAQKGGKTDPERSQGTRPDLSIARGTASDLAPTAQKRGCLG